jgi:beta-N-acetylhexosaminidase
MNNAKTKTPFPFGQFLMVGLPGPQMDEVAWELVGDLKVGGIILFARNLESPEQVWQLTHEIGREHV